MWSNAPHRSSHSHSTVADGCGPDWSACRGVVGGGGSAVGGGGGVLVLRFRKSIAPRRAYNNTRNRKEKRAQMRICCTRVYVCECVCTNVQREPCVCVCYYCARSVLCEFCTRIVVTNLH